MDAASNGDGGTPVIRLYRESDRDAMFDICMRTGWFGGDARGFYQDQELLPDIFAAPFTALEPHLAFVLDNGERAVGYVVGTSDTVRFAKEFRERWLPLVAERHPRPTDEPTSHDEVMANLLHNPEGMINPDLADYPAHLHIDILPEYQGRGYGRGLMRAQLTALHEAGAPRVFLGMLTANTAARAFYDRLGFHVIPVANAGPLTHLGRSTSEPL
ncbi:MAG TPA: GNAT family N-acetyltransferase [Actinocrinis sp.]|jgi:ribosomal protein S18 acetylase RimI-like enzyme|uniref:GNAT family N-acetyltransferase n=1 Tax=Actinocrinis sp. TaxID=1920516 RepID=UPI002DDCF1E8|nr:GNAT family N-acetyltransferase [Actinocrinis sp.]HEV3168779.1 GNAT family N-acetyltransferase [Actinocrinis sp.]